VAEARGLSHGLFFLSHGLGGNLTGALLVGFLLRQKTFPVVTFFCQFIPNSMPVSWGCGHADPLRGGAFSSFSISFLSLDPPLPGKGDFFVASIPCILSFITVFWGRPGGGFVSFIPLPSMAGGCIGCGFCFYFWMGLMDTLNQACFGSWFLLSSLLLSCLGPSWSRPRYTRDTGLAVPFVLPFG